MKGALRSYLVHSFAKIGGANPNRPHSMSRRAYLSRLQSAQYIHAGHEAIILHVTPYYQPFFRAFMPSMWRHLRATLMAQKGPSEHGGKGYLPFRFWQESNQTLLLKKALVYKLSRIFRPSYGPYKVISNVRSKQEWQSFYHECVKVRISLFFYLFR